MNCVQTPISILPLSDAIQRWLQDGFDAVRPFKLNRSTDRIATTHVIKPIRPYSEISSNGDSMTWIGDLDQERQDSKISNSDQTSSTTAMTDTNTSTILSTINHISFISPFSLIYDSIDLNQTSRSKSLPVQLQKAFLEQTLPMKLGSLTINFPITNCGHTATEVQYHWPNQIYQPQNHQSSTTSSSSSYSYTSTTTIEQQESHPDYDQHYVPLQLPLPESVQTDGPFIHLSIGNVVELIHSFYQPKFTSSEWHHLQTLASQKLIGDSDTEEYLTGAIIGQPQFSCNWSEAQVTFALEKLDLNTDGTFEDKMIRLEDDNWKREPSHWSPACSYPEYRSFLGDLIGPNQDPGAFSLSCSWSTANDDVRRVVRQLWHRLRIRDLRRPTVFDGPMARDLTEADAAVGVGLIPYGLGCLILWYYIHLIPELDLTQYGGPTPPKSKKDSSTDYSPCARYLLVGNRELLESFQIDSCRPCSNTHTKQSTSFGIHLQFELSLGIKMHHIHRTPLSFLCIHISSLSPYNSFVNF